MEPSGAADVTVWLVDLGRSAVVLDAFAAATGCLAADDVARAGTAADAGLRAERLRAYTALRWALERRLGSACRGVAFARGPEGKPWLPGADVAFNLSHTAGAALIAVGGAGDVGVDIESDRRVGIAARYRDGIVAAGLGLVPGPAGRVIAAEAAPDAAFLQAWARLEAFAKARGVGVARILTDLGLRGPAAGADRTAAEVAGQARRLLAAHGLCVTDLVVPNGFQAAFAGPARLDGPAPVPFPVDWPSLVGPLRI